MKDYKDYGKFDSAKPDNSHYSEPSMYGKLVREQYNMQPKYCERPMKGGMPASSSKQPGPAGNK